MASGFMKIAEAESIDECHLGLRLAVSTALHQGHKHLDTLTARPPPDLERQIRSHMVSASLVTR